MSAAYLTREAVEALILGPNGMGRHEIVLASEASENVYRKLCLVIDFERLDYDSHLGDNAMALHYEVTARGKNSCHFQLARAVDAYNRGA